MAFHTHDTVFLLGTGTNAEVIPLQPDPHPRVGEELSAEKDPDGNWGNPAQGFQLSMTFDKPAYALGETIIATLLLRNAATNVLDVEIRTPFNHVMTVMDERARIYRCWTNRIEQAPSEGITETFAIPTITNYQWAIPNDPISNYVATATYGRVYDLTAFNYTNAAIPFYWWKPGTGVLVQCSVMVEGFAMSARMRFNVKKPEASMTAQIVGSVAVDYEYVPGQPALHFGKINGPVGIRFTRSLAVWGEWQWLQLINSVRRVRDGTTGTWKRSQGTGLDAFPYPEVNLMTSDSPGLSFAGNDAEGTISDAFVMYLMFRPPGPAIYVPIAQVGWTWSGHALLDNGIWTSVPVQSPPTIAIPPGEADSYPTWEDHFEFPWLPE